VKIGTEISWHSAGPVITLNSRITTTDYADTLGNQVRPVVQMFPNNDAVFKMTIRPCTRPEVFNLGLRSTKMHFSTFPGQNNRQTYSNRCGQL
jgi:hypothetical protein